MPEFTSEYVAQRRDEILDSALRCFADHGFWATSMADVIVESGLPAQTVNLYFAAKSDLACAVLRRAVFARAGDIARLMRGGRLTPPSELIRSISDSLTEEGLSSSLILQIWGGTPTGGILIGRSAGSVTNDQSALLRYLQRWAAEECGLSSSAARAWADDVVPAFEGLIRAYVVQRGLFPEAGVERYLRAIDRLLGSRYPAAPAEDRPSTKRAP